MRLCPIADSDKSLGEKEARGRTSHGKLVRFPMVCSHMAYIQEVQDEVHQRIGQFFFIWPADCAKTYPKSHPGTTYWRVQNFQGKCLLHRLGVTRKVLKRSRCARKQSLETTPNPAEMFANFVRCGPRGAHQQPQTGPQRTQNRRRRRPTEPRETPAPHSVLRLCRLVWG